MARLISGSMLLFALLVSPASAEGAEGRVDAFLEAYSAAAPSERAGLARGFLAERSGAFPIVAEGGAVTFVYLGPGEDVRLVGDFAIPRLTTRWDPDGVAMWRVAQDGQLWVRQMELPEDARVLYRVVVDGEAIADPLNPRTLDDPIRGGPVSELAMPGYPAPVHAVPIADDEEIARGHLVVLDEPWADPKVTVYLPPGYPERDPDRPYPTLYTADGSAWMSAGTFEEYITEDLEAVSAWLRRSGAEVETERSREAHNMGTWRHMAPRMLTWYFAPD